MFYRINECKFGETTTAMKNTTSFLIALQLNHPDACFYDLQVGDDGTVSGFFEAYETGVAFEVSLESFLWAAQRLNFLGDYDQRLQNVWVSDSFEGHECDALGWVESMVEFGDKDTQDILKDAIRVEFEEEVNRLAREIASGAASHSVTKRILRTVDADFCDAVEQLAGIIQAANTYQEQEETANE